MSTNDWTELTRLWQSDVPAAAPALEVIAKQQRRAWAWTLTWITEVVCTIVGVVVSVWAMIAAKQHGLIIGAGALALTLFAAGASLWARSLRRPPAADLSVLASLEANSYSAPPPEGVDETWIDYFTGAPMAAPCPDAVAVPVPETDYYPRAFGCDGETGFGARIRSWLDGNRQ